MGGGTGGQGDPEPEPPGAGGRGAPGWATTGTTDAVAWLSNRLEMPYVYGPAADGQFGNAVLSRFPIVDWAVGELPKSSGSRPRGSPLSLLDIGRGDTVRV